MNMLEKLRKERNLSISKLSILTGLNYNILWQTEKGYRKAYPKMVEALSKFFEIEPQEIFEADGTPKKVS
ncbi:helix-turn-helix domain-containing protein [Caldicellulosiruptor acetigenus]|uniref:helix-turn-helix domain-containing protein n=1 Tax=Caldicellulosiruptor acetigenus TaxID=301953 RepID=UPI0004100212|nr:helix-turn-helix domain-containing protein [Caldicellulosiruptor acetigenus]WAM35595.1 helix-turn-helix transcriptional regulator [Caldicellulosiruptor acetigenus]